MNPASPPSPILPTISAKGSGTTGMIGLLLLSVRMSLVALPEGSILHRKTCPNVQTLILTLR